MTRRGPLDLLGWLTLLAVCCALPGGVVLAHGGLLASQGRVARGEGLARALVPGWEARKLLAVLALAVVALFPAWILAQLAFDARLIDPLARARWGLVLAATIAGALGAGLISGRVRRLAELRPPTHLLLAGFGLVGAATWLAIPTAVLAFGRERAPLGVLGGILLAVIAVHLPFLQARFTAEERLSAHFELAAVREGFRRAPISHLLALSWTVLATFPLSLLRIGDLPRDARALAALLLLPLLLSARLAAGLAYARGQRRTVRAPQLLRIGAWAAAFLVGGIYALLVWLAPVFAAQGVAVVLESPAFLLPLPL